MTKKILGSLAALALVIAIAPAAHATCSPAKAFGTYDFDDPVYYYVYNFSGDTAAAVGAFWQPGARVDANEGSYTIDNYLRQYTATKWYLSGNLGDGGVVGCPSGQMALSMTDGANYAIGIESETPAKGNAYNFGNMTFAPIPRPRATSSSRSGDTVSGNFEVSAIGVTSRSGLAATDLVSGIQIYSFTGQADPGRDAAAWNLVETVAYAGGLTTAAFSADCTDTTSDVFYAVGIEMTGEYSTVSVSESTVIECDPALADPDDKFKIIRDRGKGNKKGQPFQQDTSLDPSKAPTRRR